MIGKNIIFILQDAWKYTIVVYNSHLGEVEDMEMEWYKEAEDQNQAVVVVVVVGVCAHCSIDHAIRDMQADHNHGLVVAAADGPEEVGMGQLLLGESGMEEEADDVTNHMEEEGDHRKELVAAQIADNKVFGDEDLFVYLVFDFDFPLEGSCC